jgi:hypothetical protein
MYKHYQRKLWSTGELIGMEITAAQCLSILFRIRKVSVGLKAWRPSSRLSFPRCLLIAESQCWDILPFIQYPLHHPASIWIRSYTVDRSSQTELRKTVNGAELSGGDYNVFRDFLKENAEILISTELYDRQFSLSFLWQCPLRRWQ